MNYLRKKWIQQPQNLMNIDRGNYFGSKFRMGLLGSIPNILFGGENRIFKNSIAGNVTKSFGLSGRLMQSTSDSTWNVPFFPDLEVTSPITTIMVLNTAGSADNTWRIYYKGTSYGWYFGFNSWDSELRILNQGGYWQGSSNVSDTQFFSRHSTTVIAWSWKNVSGTYNVDYYRNGLYVESVAVALSDSSQGTIGSTPDDCILSANFVGGAVTEAPHYSFMGIFAGHMNASQIQDLSENPWQVFRREKNISYSFPFLPRAIKSFEVRGSGNIISSENITSSEWANVSSFPWTPRVRITSIT